MSSDTLDENYNEVPKAKRKKLPYITQGYATFKNAVYKSDKNGNRIATIKGKDYLLLNAGCDHLADFPLVPYGKLIEAEQNKNPQSNDYIQFASHLTGHSEITIKAMYQEWIVNKNQPFKPL